MRAFFEAESDGKSNSPRTSIGARYIGGIDLRAAALNGTVAAEAQKRTSPEDRAKKGQG